ncbi:tyrosine-type recombinase/integrase [Thermodesulfobacteriota bacterium]
MCRVPSGQFKKNTIRNYEYILCRFSDQFAERELGSITPDEILLFLTRITEGSKQATKRVRYSLLKAFFNFVINTVDSNLQNPCNTPILRKIFKAPKPVQWSILEKEAVDEIIFRQVDIRDRIILELMAHGGMRVSEVLKLRPRDIDDRKLTLIDPKSGKEVETVCIPQKLAGRLKEYVRIEKIGLDDRIFPLCYASVRIIVKKAGKLIGLNLKTHDLRRHSATFASRSGIPIEIISKIILRHANLSTTKPNNCIPSKL